MRYTCDLTLRRTEGVLNRVIGTAERRGFPPVAVDGRAADDGVHWHLKLTVESDRHRDSLKAQLSKLYDCLSVEVSLCP